MRLMHWELRDLGISHFISIVSVVFIHSKIHPDLCLCPFYPHHFIDYFLFSPPTLLQFIFSLPMFSCFLLDSSSSNSERPELSPSHSHGVARQLLPLCLWSIFCSVGIRRRTLPCHTALYIPLFLQKWNYCLIAIKALCCLNSKILWWF